MKIYNSPSLKNTSHLSVSEKSIILAKPDCIHCQKNPIYSNNFRPDSRYYIHGSIKKNTPSRRSINSNDSQVVKKLGHIRKSSDLKSKILDRAKSDVPLISNKRASKDVNLTLKKRPVDINNSFGLSNLKTSMVSTTSIGTSMKKKMKPQSSLLKPELKKRFSNVVCMNDSSFLAAYEFRFKIFVSNNFEHLIRPFLSCTNYINIKFSHILEKKKRISDRRLMAIERHSGCRFVLPRGPVLCRHKGKDCIFAAILGPEKESLKKAISTLHSIMPEIASSFQFNEEDIVDISSELNDIFGIKSLKLDLPNDMKSVQVSTIEDFLQERNLNDIVAEPGESAQKQINDVSIENSDKNCSHSSSQQKLEDNTHEIKDLSPQIIRKDNLININETDSTFMIDKLEKKLNALNKFGTNNEIPIDKRDLNKGDELPNILKSQEMGKQLYSREKSSFYSGVKAVLDKIARTKSIRNQTIFDMEKYEVYNIDEDGQVREGQYEPYNKIITLLVLKHNKTDEPAVGYIECKLVDESVRLFRHNFEGELLSKRLSLLGEKCHVSFLNSEVFNVKDAKMIRVKMNSKENSSLLLATQFVFHLIT